MSAPDPTAGASLAVVLCTADRADSLRRTVASIWTQTRLPAELLVIDDGYLDEALLARLARRCDELGIAWRYHRKDVRGLTRSRNIAARLASADVLVYLDDDVDCPSHLLEELANLFADPGIGAASPRVAEPAWSAPGARLFQYGYRLAGWWRIAPRERPPAPPPRSLRDRARVRRAPWLSGAAMAIRRGLVLEHGFRESLAGYALGEDREMAYRMAPYAWIVELRTVEVVHRREASGRADPRRFGRMTASNYLDILGSTCRLGPGEWLLLMWTFGVLLTQQAMFALGGDRAAHLEELRGLVDGLRDYFVPRLRAVFGWCGEKAEPRRRPRLVAPARRSAPRAAAIAARRTRALFVTNRLEHGGAEWMLVSLVRRLAEFGVDPLVACLKDAGPLADECRVAGVPVVDQLLSHKFDGTVIPRLARLAHDQRVSAIVAVGSGGDRMFWSTLAGRAAGARVVVWSHWCPTADQQRFELANRALYRLVDRYVALGRRHAEALARWEFVPRGRIEIIHNGIDLSRFDAAGRRHPARAALGLGNGAVGIGIVANLRPEKRHDVFIAAAAQVAARHPEARFFIIGDGPARESVAEAARRSGLPADVLRLMGARDDVPVLLAGLDVCCLCSELECFSLTMLEAAAAGCAFVGPRCGSLDEFLEPERTGLAVSPADASSLAAALDRLAADAVLRRRVADAARARVQAEFGIERTCRGFADLLGRLARSG